MWNRQRFVKDPDTGRRQARPNPESEWIVQQVPELRIVDDALWQDVKARQQSINYRRRDHGGEEETVLRERRRPRYLLSGLIRCGCCGGGFSMISGHLVGCSTARNKGTCDNRATIRRDQLEERVLNALRHHLMDPALFKEFCDEFTREMNRRRMEGSAALAAARAEIGRLDRQLKAMVDAIAEGMYHPSMKDKMTALEDRKATLQQFLADAEEPPPLLHPEMATFYRDQVTALYEALQDDCEAVRLQAGEILRSLVKEIILTPAAGEMTIDVRGDLAGILAVATKTKTPAFGAGASQFEMVAGAGFEPATFRL
ncbi:MAG: recombinase zinc beta ribbon domain-containing protein [Bacteroidota bacterium]